MTQMEAGPKAGSYTSAIHFDSAGARHVQLQFNDAGVDQPAALLWQLPSKHATGAFWARLLAPIVAWLEQVTGTTNYAVTFTITLLVAMALPVVLLAAAALVAGKLNGESLSANIAKFGYTIIPLDVAGHVAHN